MAIIADDAISFDTVSSTSSMASSVNEHEDPITSDSKIVVHHEEYYLEVEHVLLQVENTVFRIGAFYFLRESAEGRKLVEQARLELGRPLMIEGATAKDLERFCDVLYCRYASPPPFQTMEEWTSVLHLSHRWGFATMRALAIKNLSTLTSPVDRIVLGHTYGEDEWLLPAYKDICERTEWLSDEEGRRLGIDDVLKIGRARVEMRANLLTINPAACSLVVTRIFHQDKDSAGSESGIKDEGTQASTTQDAATVACPDDSDWFVIGVLSFLLFLLLVLLVHTNEDIPWSSFYSQLTYRRHNHD